MNRLQGLHEAGQSIWLDFLRRSLIMGGGLERLVREDAVSGVTSNPTIFAKAISGSTDYDEAVGQLAEKGAADPLEMFYDLALDDIAAAADVFRPLYDRSDGRDGFVSFELEPRLAHDSAGSVGAARELFDRIGKPNVMIKVPGTAEGAPAVEELTAAGVNVNITLLFSVARYEEVALAYLAGLERRLDAGEPLDRVASVASFFVSRVDTAVDAVLPERSALRGKAAVANAKEAYQRFRRLFSGERWERLAAAGARVQRPLWASTGTKNPAYPDTLYVEELIGPDTVNTMPEATLDAFRDHGRVRPRAVLEGIEEAQATLALLSEYGVDLEAITARLVEDGLAAFDVDLAKLLSVIEAKLGAVRHGPGRPRQRLGQLEERVNDRLARAGDLVGRIWRRDHTVWKPEPAEITDRLGWLSLPELMGERVGELRHFAEEVRSDGFERVVLCGMGGSSLAPEVLAAVVGPAPGGLPVSVLDTTHPAAIADLEGSLDLDRTLFLVASKSGGTVETLSHFAYFHAKIPRGANFAAITDPGTPLEALARARDFRTVFTNPPDLGGRYSALSLFGLVPAALLGIDLDALLDAAQEMACACHACVPCEDNPGAFLGVVLGEAARAGRNTLTLALPAALAPLGGWVEQLIAESTGKEGTGILPVAGEDLGPPEVYGPDRLFVAVGDHGALEALGDAGHPVVGLPETTGEGLGAEFFRWEFATAVAGAWLGINPFDQPNVAEAKEATRRLLDTDTRDDPGFDDPEPLLASLEPGQYLAIQAYVEPTGETEAALQRARLAIRDRHRVATTVGFGPRYLHSTGQFHKGGPPTGAFLQIVDTAREVDLPIPDKPFSFGTLLDAQALGDLQSLRQRGRPVARLTLERLEEAVSS
jgi:transaldolase / glucose-6-phosphate isomerase